MPFFEKIRNLPIFRNKKELSILLIVILESVFNTSAICVHVTGKFKGKARRTNLIYFKRSITDYNPGNINKTILYSYSNDYALTKTGSFGIKT